MHCSPCSKKGLTYILLQEGKNILLQSSCTVITGRSSSGESLDVGHGFASRCGSCRLWKRQVCVTRLQRPAWPSMRCGSSSVDFYWLHALCSASPPSSAFWGSPLRTDTCPHTAHVTHTHTPAHTHTHAHTKTLHLPACLPAYLIAYTDTHAHPWFRFLSLRFHSRSVNDRTGTLSSQRRRHTSEALSPSACESLVRPCIAGWP